MSNTRHIDGCERVFARYDLTCQRCRELAAGFTPRARWNDRRDHEDALRTQAIHRHFADPNHGQRGHKCYPVCTAFDY